MRTGAICVVVGLASALASAGDGLRIVTWNISNYSGGRQADLTTAIYGEFNGLSMDPDIILAQEILSQSATNALLAILNSAPTSPGDWAAAPFIDGPDTDGAMFYRTSKIDFLNLAILPADAGTTGAPRNVQRYDVRLVGYQSPAAELAMYNSHMKAGSSSTDQARRLIEAQKIRTNAQALDPAIHILLAGDFNIQSSSQTAYQHLIASQANNNGRFLDPIATLGNWNNNFSFRFVHTQDPIGAGGMDDRHDQILLDGSLGDGVGLEYRGAFGTPYSTTTWDDPNHSYRSWGNDGTTFDLALRTVGNAMVGEQIAIALRNVAAGGGHLPVFADFVVPARVDAPVLVDLGAVPAGSLAQGSIVVGNGGDAALWGASGIADLAYLLEADAGITVPAGVFFDEASGDLNEHAFSIDISGLGLGQNISGQIRVLSDDLDNPTWTIDIIGTIAGCSAADFAPPFGVLDFFDIRGFLSAYALGQPAADFNSDSSFDFFDIQLFLVAFAAGCP